MVPRISLFPDWLLHKLSELQGSLVQHPLPTAEGSTSQSDEPSSATAQSFLAWNPSMDPHVESALYPICNVGLPTHPYVLSKPDHYSSLSPGITLLIMKFLLGICWSFPNDPPLKVQIRCHLLPNVFTQLELTVCFQFITTPFSKTHYFLHLHHLLVSREFSAPWRGPVPVYLYTFSLLQSLSGTNNCPECLINEGMRIPSSGRREWLGFSSTLIMLRVLNAKVISPLVVPKPNIG